jgi:platelet-activating factor acetylhydrolase
MLSNPPPTREYIQIPVTRALVLDPWLEPLPSPGPAPYLTQNSGINPELTTPTTSSSESTLQVQAEVSDVSKLSSLPRMLVLNSDPFTLWKEHFSRLKSVVEAWEPEGRRVLTLGEQFDHVDTTMTYSYDCRIQCALCMYHSQTFICFPLYEGQVQRS